MEGWISVHRTILNNWVWDDKPFAKGQAWIDILMMANHKGNKFPLGNELVFVDRGSFITSELKLMDRWGWGKTKTRAFLKLLEADNMIVKKSDRKRTTITVCNYNIYQDITNQKQTDNRPMSDHKQTDSRPIADTNNNDNNDNNVNNDNKKKISRFTPPTLDQVKEYCIERSNSVIAEKFIDFYSSKGWMVGKNKMKDWKACIRTWEKSDSVNYQEATKDDRKEDANGTQYVEPVITAEQASKFYDDEYIEQLDF